MKKLIFLIAFLWASMASAATVPTTGLVFTTNCANISNPVANETLCFQTTTAGGRTGGQLYVYNGSSYTQISGGGAPTDATYITQTPDGTLTNEQALSALSTGILKNTTTTGVASIAVAGTDYVAPGGAGTISGLTTGTLPKASSATALTNSIIAESAGVATVTGGVNVTGLTASRPVITDSSKNLASGTYSGNTTKLATTTGTLTSGNCAEWDASGNIVQSSGACGIAGSGYGTIQEEGSNLTARTTMNFIGDQVTAADDAGNSRTNITVAVTDANLSTTDVTTNDVSTSKHGFAPKAPNDATKYLDGTGNYSVPAGSGGGGLTLIEHKTITADAQSYTFSGLNGNTDGIYYFFFKFINGGSTSFYTLQPNGVTSNQSGQRFYSDNGSGSAGSIASTLEISFATATVQSIASGYFYARDNPNSVAATRQYVSQFSTFATTVTTGHYAGRWNETSTNITSLVVTGDQSDSLKSGSELFLYKLAQ